MEVVWLRRAQQHLAEIIIYIVDDNATAATSLIWSGLLSM
jgi:plasmid stabilization system protein ParE